MADARTRTSTMAAAKRLFLHLFVDFLYAAQLVAQLTKLHVRSMIHANMAISPDTHLST